MMLVGFAGLVSFDRVNLALCEFKWVFRYIGVCVLLIKFFSFWVSFEGWNIHFWKNSMLMLKDFFLVSLV